MTLWIIMIALAICTAAIMALPMYLRRGDTQITRQAYDIAVYKDQLAEVERDLKRNTITVSEAENIRYEIQQRVLATQNDEAGKSGEIVTKPSFFILAIVVIIPIFSAALYLDMGSPDTPDYPHAERNDTQAPQPHNADNSDAPDMDEVIATLQERLKQSPDDIEGWSMLARSLMVVDRYDEAAQTYKKIYEMTGDIMDKSEYAEAALMANNSVFTPVILTIFHEISKADPLDPRARFYIGMEALQSGNVQAALQIWIDLLYISPPDAPWFSTVEAQINQAANDADIDPNTIKPSQKILDIAGQLGTGQTEPGPTAEDVENAQSMTSSEQDEMIRSMVQGLADKLAENPNDPEGWMRLIKAYEVLGEVDKAAQARTMAGKYSN
ncbi:MAG: c-type cytochrome biogenesis protein CcmI [Rhodospirillales bacterium]|jgi:cytochrome c-type biogenesis protein CcmH|nr:c-type cytochrome biogenesis protein CcmI [Rhodospirillales bacterium]